MHDDKDLFEQLRRGPLTRNGFNDELRKKINERIDQPKRRLHRFRFLRWIPVGSALLFLVVVLCGVWLWKGLPFSGFGNQNDALNADSAASERLLPARFARKEPQSAILIGLRKDAEAGNGSSYRTILVAPHNKKLVVAAEGPGVWMPYKQKFWKIDTALGSGGATEILVSSPADSNRKVSVDIPPRLRRTEKLLYAGNRYVSILQSTEAFSDGNNVNQTSIWVKEIEQLTAGKRERDLRSGAEPHFNLSQLIDTDNTAAQADQWTIARVPGKWVAKQPSDPLRTRDADSLSEWEEIPVPLTSDVLSHDTLSLPWDNIYTIERNARDAFTSPTEDLVAVVTDASVDIYPYGLPDYNKRALKLPIDASESIVMVQWATSTYVNAWKQQLNEWIPPTKGD